MEAIRAVVAIGKICVLNLHPQSLKLLRSSDLKPYVVLVAPPSLEKLRLKKIRSGEPFKVSDSECKFVVQNKQHISIAILGGRTEGYYCDGQGYGGSLGPPVRYDHYQ